MTRYNFLCMGILLSLCTNASALPAAKQLIGTSSDLNVQISKLSTPIDPPNALFPANSNQGRWIQEKLGDDFYHFYSNKAAQKTPSKKFLQLEYFLKPAPSANPYPSNDSNLTKSAIPPDEFLNHSIQTLEPSKISFAEDGLEWNPTDISIVTLGEDYQKFIDDEITAGHTYKEFWDGVETTAFEDFIDEHFGFHDNALLRYMALLGILLVTVLAVARRAVLADFVMSDENVERLKKWFRSLHHFN